MALRRNEVPPQGNGLGGKLIVPFRAHTPKKFLKVGPLLMLLILVQVLSLQAQTATENRSARDAVLEGKGMFQQRCAVCHLPLVIDDERTYGPRLSAETVTGKETIIREFIRRGTPRMPGFQYGLEPEEIDSIISYLRTVKKAESK